MSLLTFERSRSKFKVKVEGQNSRTEILPLAIAQLWFDSPTEVLSAQNMAKFKPVASRRFALSWVLFLAVYLFVERCGRLLTAVTCTTVIAQSSHTTLSTFCMPLYFLAKSHPVVFLGYQRKLPKHLAFILSLFLLRPGVTCRKSLLTNWIFVMWSLTLTWQVVSH